MTFQPKPLTEAQRDRLAGFLEKCNGGKAMNLEKLDGFFCALVAGPDLVPPSEYYPIVFGQEEPEDVIFENRDEANEIFQLLMTHWNQIVQPLLAGDVYMPILYEEDDGTTKGSDWARGFDRGIDMRRRDWAPLVDDEENAGWLVPVFALYHEHDADPAMRPAPITAEKREELILLMAASVLPIYQFFRAREKGAQEKPVVPPPRPVKIGRNQHCPCGSGKKYKKCCGASVH